MFLTIRKLTEKSIIMITPFKLLIALQIAFLSAFAVNAANTSQEYSSAVNKDTIFNYYRLMDVKILADSSSDKTSQKITFTNRNEKAITVDFSRVYELSFYLIAGQETQLSLILFSGENASDTFRYDLPKSNGHYQKVIFPMTLGGTVNPEKITAIQIQLQVTDSDQKTKTQIDEFVFNYFDTPIDTKTGKPNFDNEVLKKEYQEYLDQNKNQIRPKEPVEEDPWTKGNKSVKAK